MKDNISTVALDVNSLEEIKSVAVIETVNTYGVRFALQLWKLKSELAVE